MGKNQSEIESNLKKMKKFGFILFDFSIFFQKNTHLTVIKQRVKWASVVAY